MFYSFTNYRPIGEYRPVFIAGTRLPILIAYGPKSAQSSGYLDIMISPAPFLAPSLVRSARALRRYKFIVCDPIGRDKPYRVTPKGIHALKCTFVTMLVTGHPLCDVLGRWLVERGP